MTINNNRIAIISTPESKKRNIASILGEILDVDVIGASSFESTYPYIFKNAINSFFSIGELYTVVLAQFHERLRAEKSERFISDGSVLKEFVLLKVKSDNYPIKRSVKNIVLKDKYKEFIKKIERTIVDYAAITYDKVYLIEEDNCVSDYHKIVIDIIKSRKIEFKIFKGPTETIIEEILADIGYGSNNCGDAKEIINKHKQHKS